MRSEEIAVGIRVRYPRTGTTGKILDVRNVNGQMFAEIDSTNLLYRIDQLIPMTAPEKITSAVTEDAKIIAAREREYAASGEYQDALKNIDQSCEGGG